MDYGVRSHCARVINKPNVFYQHPARTSTGPLGSPSRNLRALNLANHAVPSGDALHFAPASPLRLRQGPASVRRAAAWRLRVTSHPVLDS